MLSHVQLFSIPWSIACQAPLSMEFSRQKYWSEYPFPSPGYLPDPGIKPVSPAGRQILYHLSHQGSPCFMYIHHLIPILNLWGRYFHSTVSKNQKNTNWNTIYKQDPDPCNSEWTELLWWSWFMYRDRMWTIYKAYSWKLSDILHKWPQKTELNTERLSMHSMYIGALPIVFRFDIPTNGEIYFNLNHNITRMHMPVGQKKLLMHGKVKYKKFYVYPFFVSFRLLLTLISLNYEELISTSFIVI